MTSQIDATLPVIGNPTTESVRSNFAIAAAEISDLQDMLDNLELSLAGYLPLIGGQMTGPLLLSADPTQVLGAVTKQYADRKLALSGGTMTGPLILQADPTTPLGAATKQYVDLSMAGYLPTSGGVMTGPITGLEAISGLTVHNDPAGQDLTFSLKTGPSDGATLARANAQLNTWWSFGVAPLVTNQRCPPGLNGVLLDARTGNVNGIGALLMRNSGANVVNRLAGLRVYRTSLNEQMLELTANTYWLSLDPTTPIATGGSNVNPNDRFYDALENIYTVLTTDVPNGAATSIRIDYSPAYTGAAITNPIALIPAPGGLGSGLSVNLASMVVPKMVLKVGAGQTLEFTGQSGINFTNNVTVTGALSVTTVLTAGGAANGTVSIDGISAATGRWLRWRTGTSVRWQWFLSTVESTGNAGSDMVLNRYDDAGVSLGSVLTINRATGLITFSGLAGVSYGNRTVGTTTDLSSHIALFSTNYGFNMTAGRMNLVAAGQIWAVINGVDAVQFSASGINGVIGGTTPAAGTFTQVKTLSASGPTWTAGTGAPSGSQPVGSMYSRTDGTAGARLYVSAGGGTWNPVAAV